MQLRFPNMPEQITKADAKILEYISNNTEAFLFSSIGKFAAQLGISEATVSRFVRHVGCRDYKELKRLVTEQIAFEGPAAKMAETLNADAGFTLENWMLRQQTYLQKTLESVDKKAFSDAVAAILHAHRVFIHAKSASASLGQLLLFRLRRMGIETILLPSGGSEVLEGLAQVEKDDIVLLFSFSKVSAEGKMILCRQKEIGYQTIAFCSRMFVPPAERADIQLFVYRGEPEEYHSMTAPAAMVDALAVAVSEALGPDCAKRLSDLHRMKKSYAPDR